MGHYENITSSNKVAYNVLRGQKHFYEIFGLIYELEPGDGDGDSINMPYIGKISADSHCEATLFLS